jgi:hypothetical protein
LAVPDTLVLDGLALADHADHADHVDDAAVGAEDVEDDELHAAAAKPRRRGQGTLCRAGRRPADWTAGR